MAAVRQTRDHTEIRRWVERRGGVPAFVKGTHGRLLRIDFTGNNEGLEQVTWAKWFEVFDRLDLVFVCEPGAGSRFFDLIPEESAV